jgi:hypothetical protein
MVDTSGHIEVALLVVWKQPSEPFSPAVNSTLNFETWVAALKFVKLIVILVQPRLDEMVGMHRCTFGAVVGNCTYEYNP